MFPAFRLSDEGFDVWIGNCRGTKYSTHEKMSIKRPRFWDFRLVNISNKNLQNAICNKDVSRAKNCRLLDPQFSGLIEKPASVVYLVRTSSIMRVVMSSSPDCGENFLIFHITTITKSAQFAGEVKECFTPTVLVWMRLRIWTCPPW